MTNAENMSILKTKIEDVLEYMLQTTTTMQTLFTESGEVQDLDAYFEQLTLLNHDLVRYGSMYGYFEALEAGHNPLS